MDPRIKEILKKEEERQQNNIELIASENYTSKAVRELAGSIFTNKYAEGYPGKRYYGGCEYIDEMENLAIEYACKLFDVKYANVQPHCGSSANMAVYRALLEPGDKVMGMNLSHGGHLTHGNKMSFSGQDYEIVSYDLNLETEELDYEAIRKLALEEKPKMIIAGASAYAKKIDFQKFAEIAHEVGAYLFVDMAHIAGLVAAHLHQNPCLFADVVTSTTHKTLRGPRGGIILTNDEEIAKKINKAVFPGIQGGPLEHIIAAKAECFYEALQPSFKEYQEQVLKNMQVLCETLKEEGFVLISGGSENHLVLVDVKSSVGMTGKEAEEILDQIHITVNKNTIPNETEKPTVTSGIRVGSAAMTTRGFREEEFKKVGHFIAEALKNKDNAAELNKIKEEVLTLTKKFLVV